MSKTLSYKTFTVLNKMIGADTPDDKVSITEIDKGSEKFSYQYLKSLVQGKSKLVLITIAEQWVCFTMKRYLKKNYAVDYDTRLAVSVNSSVKTQFKECAAFLNMTEADCLHHLLKKFISDTVDYAAGYCSSEYELAFEDARKMLQI